MVISFRGTQEDKMKDIMADLCIAKVCPKIGGKSTLSYKMAAFTNYIIFRNFSNIPQAAYLRSNCRISKVEVHG